MPIRKWTLAFAVCALFLSALAAGQVKKPHESVNSAESQAFLEKQKLDSVSYEAVVAAAAGRVESNLRSQQDLYWSIASTVGALILGLLAFLGYGQVKSLRDKLSDDIITKLSNSASFKDTISNQIGSSVLESLRDAQTAIEQQIDFLNIRSLAEGLSHADSFSSAQRDSLFEGLIRLKDSTSITQRPEFLNALEQVFSSFFQAGLWDKIDALEKELRATAVASPGLVQSLVPSLGYRILSETTVTDETHSSLIRYIEAAKNLKFPELAYPFELAYLLYIKPENWERRSEVIFQDAENISTSDLAMFLSTVEHLCNPSNIAKTPRNYHARIADKFSAVRDRHKSKIDELKLILESRPDFDAGESKQSR